MRASLLGPALILACVLVGPIAPGRAQFGAFGSDPFSQYYGYYVPQQQSFSAQLQRGAVAGLNINAADRRASVLSQRATNLESFGPYDPTQVDPLGSRSALRPPTILIPGQPSSSVMLPDYFARTGRHYGVIGSPGGSARSLHKNPAASGLGLGRARRGMGGRGIGGMGMGGRGMGGMGMGGMGMGGGFR